MLTKKVEDPDRDVGTRLLSGPDPDIADIWEVKQQMGGLTSFHKENLEKNNLVYTTSWWAGPDLQTTVSWSLMQWVCCSTEGQEQLRTKTESALECWKLCILILLIFTAFML